MKGLAIANSPVLRRVQNSLARYDVCPGCIEKFSTFYRPADVRASLSKVAMATLHPPKVTKSKPRKRPNKSTPKKKIVEDSLLPEAYHFIAYVPFQGRVWELDGLKKAPLECAEIEGPKSSWIDAVQPALSGRMEAYSAGGDIRFNLLALVEDRYQARSDDFELLKRELTFLERRLSQTFQEEWKQQVHTMAVLHTFDQTDQNRSLAIYSS